jgi:hypothetical protein
LPRGWEVKLNGVRFDGCREEDHTMLEAKGPFFESMMTGPDTWFGWYTGDDPIKRQMEAQAIAAAGWTVERRFAEQQPADYYREYARSFSNIVEIHTPAVKP